jgi:hypothetical protein
MNIDQFLNKLDKVKSRGHNKWLACCPVHSDKTPSLAISLAEGDRLLFHCFGCGANGIEICKALDINPVELFPKEQVNYKRERVPFPADQILAALAQEATILELAANDMARGVRVDEQRVALARDRITTAVSYGKN